MELTMVKNPEKFKSFAEKTRGKILRKMSLREGIHIGEDLIRASFLARKPKPRHDKPLALSFYVHQSN